MTERLRQQAPYPDALARLVRGCTYRPGWKLTLEDVDRAQGSMGLTLDITTTGFNAYHPDRGPTYSVHHYFPVPPAAYNEKSWQRWMFDCFLMVERHEAMEFFSIDGERPYAPNHGPGHDPYTIREVSTDEERRTSFRGTLNPEAS